MGHSVGDMNIESAHLNKEDLSFLKTEADSEDLDFVSYFNIREVKVLIVGQL